MEKILRINMGAPGGPTMTTEPVGEYAGLGGRATTSLMVSKEVNPLAHPLGAENKLVIAPGMLSGTTGSMTGRISVGCKSPLTGTIKESNAGGQAAQVMARLGYAAIVLEGKPAGDDLYKIFINKDEVSPASAFTLRIQEIVRNRQAKMVFFSCDEKVLYSEAMKVMDIIKNAGEKDKPVPIGIILQPVPLT